jgi:hypothetical protein
MGRHPVLAYGDSMICSEETRRLAKKYRIPARVIRFYGRPIERQAMAMESATHRHVAYDGTEAFKALSEESRRVVARDYRDVIARRHGMAHKMRDSIVGKGK